MSDLIDKQSTIDFIDAGRLGNPNEPRWSDNEIVAFLKSRPSAEPERKIGQWVGHNADDPFWQRDDGTPVFLECSACQAFVINNGAANWNYCPNCGADMRGEKNE